jgi:hypothetical protein
MAFVPAGIEPLLVRASGPTAARSPSKNDALRHNPLPPEAAGE